MGAILVVVGVAVIAAGIGGGGEGGAFFFLRSLACRPNRRSGGYEHRQLPPPPTPIPQPPGMSVGALITLMNVHLTVVKWTVVCLGGLKRKVDHREMDEFASSVLKIIREPSRGIVFCIKNVAVIAAVRQH